ncbi:MAG: leucine-rich repeat domain-containing protein [Clostridia bacterium]|nr:leucine-rich repeat domain-containing protein [Clostridia bacterium]
MKNKLNKIKTALVVALFFALTLFVVACSTTQYRLSYAAGTGGTITGEVTQTVDEGKDGSEVIAVANSGYVFVKWSDGITTANRTDKNVQKDLSVTAEFKVDTQGSGGGSDTGLQDITAIVGKWYLIGWRGETEEIVYRKNSEYSNNSEMILTIPATGLATYFYNEGTSEHTLQSNITKHTATKFETCFYAPTAQDPGMPKVDYAEFIELKEGFLHFERIYTWQSGSQYREEFVLQKMPEGVDQKNPDGTEKGTSFFYDADQNGITITRYIGSNTSVKIPSQIDGKKVVSIGRNAFNGKKMGSVEIPSTVTKIDKFAFYYCPQLSNIKIPSSVTTVEKHVFGANNHCNVYCEMETQPAGWNTEFALAYSDKVYWGIDVTIDNDGNVYLCEDNSATLIRGNYANKEIKLPDFINGYPVVKIDEAAFYHFYYLEKITFPSKLEEIGKNAFWYCGNIKEVEIPASVKVVGYYAFPYCSKLASVTFVDNSQLEKIDEGAFSYCSSLLKIDFGKNSKLQVIKRDAFASCEGLTEVLIPASVTEIQSSAFFDCGLLKNLTFESGSQLQIIGSSAFSECESLAEVLIPSSVIIIDGSAFWNCQKLKSIIIPTSVVQMGNWIFTVEGTKIYCESMTKPVDWEETWCDSDCEVYWYSQNQPTTDGNWWHYVDGVPTIWVTE